MNGGRWRRRRLMCSAHVLDVDRRRRPTSRARRASSSSPSRHVCDGEVLLDDPLARVDRARARRLHARRPRARAARSSTRSPAGGVACAAGPRCRRARTSAVRARAPCRSSRASCRGSRRRSPARGRAARSGATTCRRSGGRESRRGSRPRRRSRPRTAAPGEPLDDLVEQVAGAVAVHRRERDRVAEAEPVELERVRLLRGVVDLVRDDDHRLVRAAEDLGDLLVARASCRCARRRRRARGRPPRPPRAPARRSSA